MYWHRLEHSPSELLKCAYSEYRSSNPGNENSWYSNILFFSEKLGLGLSICRNLSKGKFKSLLKKCIQKDFMVKNKTVLFTRPRKIKYIF